MTNQSESLANNPGVNLRIKAAIWSRGLKQRDLSRATRIPEGRLSNIILGHGRVPDAKERALIAKALNQPEVELFDEVA